MADRVKGITIELNGDVTKLNKALSSTNTQIRNTQTALRDVDKLLKLDPTNITLLEQRQRLLAQAVEETRKKLTTLREAERQAQEQFAQGKISQEQYDALQREIIATERELKNLEKAASNSNARVQQLAAATEQISQKTGEFAEKTRGLSLAAAGVVTALAGAAYSSVTLADDLNSLAKQTGFSTEELQKMQYASALVDVEMETITGAAAKLKRQMTSTSTGVTSAFNQLNVATRDANGNLRNSTDVFWDVVQALGEVSDETERDVLAMELFGKSADELAGIVDDGGAALRSLGQEAKDAGLILSQDTLDGLSAVNDKIDTLKAQAQAILAESGAKVIEAFLPLIEDLAEGAGNLADKIAALDENQIKNIGTVAAVVAAISPVSKLISGVTGAISGLIGPASSLFGLIAAHPLGAVAVGIGGVIAALALSASSVKSNVDTVESLSKAAGNLDKTLDEVNDTFSTNTARINENYNKGRDLITRLYELEKQTERTGLEEYERSQIIQELNGLYPDLNLAIDENTGALNKNVDSLLQQITALKNAAIQQALQEKYTAILKEMTAVQNEVFDNQLKLRDITALHAEAVADAEAKTEAYNAALAARNAIEDEGSVAWANAETALRAAEAEMEAAAAKVIALEDAQTKLTDAIQAGEDQIQKYASEYEEAVTGIASLMNNAGYNAGANYGEGLARGISAKKNRVAAAAEELARGVIVQGNRTLEISSPSKAAKRMGEFWDEGLVIGLQSGTRDVSSASQEVAQTVMQSSPVTNNNVTTNNTHSVGGIYVTVNAADGQNAEDIAEVVMNRIQEAVEREEAAL